MRMKYESPVEEVTDAVALTLDLRWLGCDTHFHTFDELDDGPTTVRALRHYTDLGEGVVGYSFRDKYGIERKFEIIIKEVTE